MLSPPASIDPITVSAFAPLFAPSLGQPEPLVDQLAQPDPLGQHRRRQQPRVRHQIRLGEAHRDPTQV